MSFIGNISEFNTSDDWEVYAERIEEFFNGNDIKEERRVPLFISIIGQETYSLLRSLCFPAKPSSKNYNELVDILAKHFKPKVSCIAERSKFRNCFQKDGESIVEYVARIKRAATNCHFEGNLEEALRDQLVCGIQNENIKKRLLLTPDLTYGQAVEIACAVETVDKNTTDMSKRTAQMASVNKVVLDRRPKPNRHYFKGKNTQEEKRIKSNCGRCGGDHNDWNCPKKHWTCNYCRKVGHLAKFCHFRRQQREHQPKMSHRVHGLEAHSSNADIKVQSSDSEEQIIQTIEVRDTSPSLGKIEIKRSSRYEVPLEIEGIPFKMELDTGAAVSVISETIYQEKLNHIPVNKSDLSLKTYTGEEIPVKGSIQVNVKYGNQKAMLPLVVIPVQGQKQREVAPLLGRNWLQRLKLQWDEIFNLTINSAEINQQTAVELEKNLVKKYSEVFQEGTGCIQNYKANISIKEDATPKFMKARPVPYALKAKVGAELERLEKEGVIFKVDHSNWATPLVVVPKSNGKDVRLCGDYSVTINPVSVLNHYPLPNTEDLFASLAGGKIFTKLDLSNAYQQLELTEQSASLLTVNSHLGLYQYRRLPFGVASAPAIFQSVMDQILQGLPNVFCYLDDVLITGHDLYSCTETVTQVLERLQRHGIRVNSKKCIFFAAELEYLGHRIDGEGIHPTKSKVEAIRQAPEPKSVSELRAFLGLLNYYRKFLPNLATELHPLYELLQLGKRWKWDENCRRAFQRAKEALLNNNLLIYYDSTKPLVLACDASPVGLGAVLSHVFPDGQEKPIAFASRTLSNSEKNYAQIEKEAASIVFGIKKFHRFLYGRTFTLLTDHKPLTTILGPKTAIPTIAAARLQRWALLLNAYQYEIKYREGSQMGNADSLSRLPLTESKQEELYYFAPMKETPLQVLDISRETKKDTILSRVFDWSKFGWPNQVEEVFNPYFIRRNELSIEEDCVTWGNRVIIPSTLRRSVLDLLHEEHPGIVRMKLLARSYFWWPKLDADIEESSRNCAICQAHAKNIPPAQFQPWTWATSSWERVHLDLAFTGKHKFLIVTDAHSKWVEVKELQQLHSENIIKELRTLFASHGLPETVVNDNGLQFTSTTFRKFLEQNGIRQILTPPYHPSSNGAVERTVQHIKMSLKKMCAQDVTTGRVRDIRHKLDCLLLAYRVTPHTMTQKSPAQLFLKRELRTRLSQLKPDLNKNMKGKTTQLKEKIDMENRRRPRNFEVGDTIYARTLRGEKESWLAGVVTKRIGSVLYEIETEDGKRRLFHADYVRARLN